MLISALVGRISRPTTKAGPGESFRVYSRMLRLLFAVLVPLNSFAQDSMETDRPGLAIHAATLNPQKFQLETGIGYSHSISNQYNVWTIAPTSIMRYGLLEGLELRLQPSFGYSEGMIDSSKFVGRLFRVNL